MLFYIPLDFDGKTCLFGSTFKKSNLLAVRLTNVLITFDNLLVEVSGNVEYFYEQTGTQAPS